MKPVASAVLVGVLCSGAFVAVPASVAAQRCGVSRWPVKIWSDLTADSVRRDSVVPTTISALREVPRPSGRFEQRVRRGPIEHTVFRVRARVAQVITEDDSDVHLILRDLDDPSQTIVAEIPDSICALTSRAASAYAEARRQLRRVPRDGMVEVEGIGFFDFLHGQRGMAPSGLELHPVLSLRPIPRDGRPAASASPVRPVPR
jgi:hypothetical protein